jgi:peptide/nickel transport system permease protein
MVVPASNPEGFGLSPILRLPRAGLKAFGQADLAVGAIVTGALVLFSIYGWLDPPYNPQTVATGRQFLPPFSAGHLFGTDDLGRDVLSRVAAGTGVSLFVGITSTAIALIVGALVGGVAGYAGRMIDDLLMRMTEVFMIIPAFFLAVLLLALFGPNITNIVLTIALLSWPVPARVVRSEVLSLKSRPFVDAARVTGISRLSILTGEILPNVYTSLLISGALLAGQAMLLEAALSFLGLGDPNWVSLGDMLQESQPYLAIAWWTAVFPGVVLFAAIFAINLLADGLRLRLDPRRDNA